MDTLSKALLIDAGLTLVVIIGGSFLLLGFGSFMGQWIKNARRAQDDADAEFVEASQRMTARLRAEAAIRGVPIDDYEAVLRSRERQAP